MNSGGCNQAPKNCIFAAEYKPLADALEAVRALTHWSRLSSGAAETARSILTHTSADTTATNAYKRTYIYAQAYIATSKNN